MDTVEKVTESLRIEGIDRPPTDDEIREHERFMRLETISISELRGRSKTPTLGHLGRWPIWPISKMDTTRSCCFCNTIV
jgi:hypothetical protein